MAVWNWLDWVVIAIFAMSILLGFLRGFMSEIVSIITLIAAVVIAITFADTLAIAIMNYSPIQTLVARTSNAFGGNTSEAISYAALAVSFIILFMGTIIAGSILKLFLNLALQTGILGLGNRFLGGMFGLARGYILNLVLLFLIQLTALSNEAWWQQSYFVHFFQPSIVWLDSMVTPAVTQLKAELESANITGKVQEYIVNTPNVLKKQQ